MLPAMSVNPYAASAVNDVPEAPASHGWEIRDGVLFAEKDAILPMVDPYSGQSEDSMTLIRLDVRGRTRWPRLLFLGGLLGAIVASFGPRAGILADGSLIIAFVGLIASLVMPLVTGRCWLQVFVTAATFKRNRLFRWIGRIGIVALLLFFLVAGFPVGEIYAAAILIGLLGLIIILSLLIPMFQRRLFHKGRSGDQFRIGGVHPRAIEALLVIQDRGN